jgi:hypothetical protein
MDIYNVNPCYAFDDAAEKAKIASALSLQSIRWVLAYPLLLQQKSFRVITAPCVWVLWIGRVLSTGMLF